MRTMSPKAKPSGGSTLPQVSKDGHERHCRASPLRSSCWQAAFGGLPAVYRTTGQVRTRTVRDSCDLGSPRGSCLYRPVFHRLWNFTDRQRGVHQVALDSDLLLTRGADSGRHAAKKSSHLRSSCSCQAGTGSGMRRQCSGAAKRGAWNRGFVFSGLSNSDSETHRHPLPFTCRRCAPPQRAAVQSRQRPSTRCSGSASGSLGMNLRRAALAVSAATNPQALPRAAEREQQLPLSTIEGQVLLLQRTCVCVSSSLELRTRTAGAFLHLQACQRRR